MFVNEPSSAEGASHCSVSALQLCELALKTPQLKLYVASIEDSVGPTIITPSPPFPPPVTQQPSLLRDTAPPPSRFPSIAFSLLPLLISLFFWSSGFTLSFVALLLWSWCHWDVPPLTKLSPDSSSCLLTYQQSTVLNVLLHPQRSTPTSRCPRVSTWTPMSRCLRGHTGGAPPQRKKNLQWSLKPTKVIPKKHRLDMSTRSGSICLRPAGRSLLTAC